MPSRSRSDDSTPSRRAPGRSTVYAGIDEAGYGPTLGPLCVAGAAFVIDGHATSEAGPGAPNLWRLLSSAVCRSPRDARRRIAIEDSKKLKGSNHAGPHPLRHLERGVLAFLRARDEAPDSDAELFRSLGVEVSEREWYASTTPLPLAHDCAEIAIDGARVRRALDKAGVRFESLQCRAIDAGGFNDAVARMGRKSAVNLHAALCLADAVWQRWPDAHPRIVIDRQGGRTHYREELAICWPEAHVRVIDERDDISRYTVERNGSRLTIGFETQAEERHLPVALASMTAKYVREQFMLRLNRFFGAHMPSLEPTAGYVEDARRWLREVDPLISSLGIARPALIRQV